MGGIFTEHIFPRYVGRQVMKPQMNGFDDPTLRDFTLLDSSVLMKEDLKDEMFEGSSSARFSTPLRNWRPPEEGPSTDRECT